jgi:hypothetical protein
LELFGLKWHLLGDITRTENGLKGKPTGLDLHPKIKNGVNGSELSLSLLDLLSEGSDVSIGSNGRKEKLILLELLKNLIDLVTSEFTENVLAFVGLEFELDVVPIS